MKSTKLVILSIILSLPTHMMTADTLRIMTYNIFAGGMGSMEQIGNYIRDSRTDIAAIQEIDICTQRGETPARHGENEEFLLGLHSGMTPLFCKALDHPTGGYYGIGLLSNLKVTGFYTYRMPSSNCRDPRVVMIVEYDYNGRRVVFANTHMDLKKSARRRQMKFILKKMNVMEADLKLICGDFNSPPEEGLVSTIFKDWTDALPEGQLTFASYKPYAKYDWMIYPINSTVRVLSAKIDTNVRLSDHMPCIIEIDF